MDIKQVPLSDVWAMRQSVMYPQESISFVQLEDDNTGTHLGLYDQGELVSVISLFEKSKSVQFRKFATKTNKQGLGYGTALLQYVMNHAQATGKANIWCNARTSAMSIYKKFGMQPTGATWEKWGFEFIKMEKQ